MGINPNDLIASLNFPQLVFLNQKDKNIELCPKGVA